MLFSGTYYWRVRARDSSNYTWGDWSSVWRFTYNYSFTISPSDGDSTFDTTPLLDWDNITRALRYELKIADSEADLENANILIVSESEYQVENVLNLGDSKYWCLRTVNVDGIPGVWGGPWSFTVSWYYSFTGINPSDGGNTFDTTPLLNWDDITGAVEYELQIADTEAGLENVDIIEVTESQYQIATVIEIDDVRYWRVRAVNEDGIKGSWSSVFSFTVVYDYDIRDMGPAGGIIFYDKGGYSGGWCFMEAAPAETEWDDIEWGAYGTDISGAEGTAVGAGEQNTEDIIEYLETGSTYAAQLCDGLTCGGYSDWFLPSKDELNLMYTNLHEAGLGGFTSYYYWSSSEYSSYYAWLQYFPDGYQYYLNAKHNIRARVRAVRAF